MKYPKAFGQGQGRPRKYVKLRLEILTVSEEAVLSASGENGTGWPDSWSGALCGAYVPDPLDDEWIK